MMADCRLLLFLAAVAPLGAQLAGAAASLGPRRGLPVGSP